MSRIKSLKDAVQQAIDHGATTVEEVYVRVSRLPFDQLERIASLERVVRRARGVHDQSVARLAETLRAINRRIGELADQALRRAGLIPATRPRRAASRVKKKKAKR